MAIKKVTKKAGKKADAKRKVATKKVVAKKKVVKKKEKATKSPFIGSFILVDGEPVPEPDMQKWALWFETAGEKRIVKQSKVNKYFISTIFLGLDHSFGSGTLVLWETMVWNPAGRDVFQERHSSRAKAEIAHARYVEQVAGGRELK